MSQELCKCGQPRNSIRHSGAAATSVDAHEFRPSKPQETTMPGECNCGFPNLHSPSCPAFDIYSVAAPPALDRDLAWWKKQALSVTTLLRAKCSDAEWAKLNAMVELSPPAIASCNEYLQKIDRLESELSGIVAEIPESFYDGNTIAFRVYQMARIMAASVSANQALEAELATAKQEAEMWKAEYSAEVDKTDSTFERDTQRLAAQSRELERLRGAEGKLKRVLDHVREMHVEKCGCTICEMIGAALAPSEGENQKGKL